MITMYAILVWFLPVLVCIKMHLFQVNNHGIAMFSCLLLGRRNLHNGITLNTKYLTTITDCLFTSCSSSSGEAEGVCAGIDSGSNERIVLTTGNSTVGKLN